MSDSRGEATIVTPSAPLGIADPVLSGAVGPESSVAASPVPLRSATEGARTFDGHRKVRLGDVDPLGRLRLDALGRYTQDVSDDDTTDAGLADPGWIARTTIVDEMRPAVIAEHLTFTTFCSGTGSRWAERRLSIRGDQGAHLEVMTIWVAVDPVSGRPRKLSDQFHQLYGQAAAGREASAKLLNPKVAAVADTGTPVDIEQWEVRRADLDILNHVNNAAYWTAVEQSLPERQGPRRFRIEYSSGVSRLGATPVATASHSQQQCWWWLPECSGPGQWGAAAASAVLSDLPTDLYQP